jgi:hypothetical protein
LKLEPVGQKSSGYKLRQSLLNQILDGRGEERRRSLIGLQEAMGPPATQALNGGQNQKVEWVESHTF